MKKYYIPLIICGVVLIGILYYYFFTPFSKIKSDYYLCIDDNDNIDSVISKIKPVASEKGFSALTTLIRHTSYSDKIRSGRFKIGVHDPSITIFHRMSRGLQASVMLTIPSTRTIPELADKIGKNLMIGSDAIRYALEDSAICKQYGFTKETVPCFIIPNTYNLYWNVTLEKFLERMKSEYNSFWNKERMAKAREMGLTPAQVSTLASIVDEETANESEKPIIAGLYYNRYKKGMKLQADPTIKYAVGDFTIKRIHNWMLQTESPYNTYRNAGLPPGPIRIPSVQGIDAVLNYEHHNYIFMCAKEDLSGTHNFASDAVEHMKNADRYYAALNKLGIE